jgi:D-alanyl-lipoteichoic acid acyltransferase DltB (MBOAT superfamily)
MLFNSLAFAIFFPLVVLLHFALPHRFRWAWLLGASYWFYMSWQPRYALLLFGSTFLAWAAGLLISREARPARRKAWLAACLVGNLGALFFFKYFNFANGSLRSLFQELGWTYSVSAVDVLLPVGISFFIFQSLSYAIDVYRGRQEPERHFGLFALYVSFFPQLVAGPIERAGNLLPQFRIPHAFDADRAASGLRLMLWGMFKKVVIADRLALFVDPIYDNPGAHEAPALLLATYLFAFQIFCDFSGYTDIAIGAARVMGFDLMKNFDRPYAAASVAEFWRRWHISLSTWFKDYLYYPLGGNRVARPRWMANILVVFLVSGLWHGAAWTYVVWGALHGLYLTTGALGAGLRERLAAAIGLDRLPRIRRALGVLVTFHLVLFAWIFFRARSLADALFIVKTMAAGAFEVPAQALAGVPLPLLAGCLALVAILEAVHLLQGWLESGRGSEAAAPVFHPALRWAAYLVLLLGVLNLRPAQVAPFIYFQF